MGLSFAPTMGAFRLSNVYALSHKPAVVGNGTA